MKIYPCPFCGGIKFMWNPMGGTITRVSCSCGVDGPCEVGKRNAIKAWNRRAGNKKGKAGKEAR